MSGVSETGFSSFQEINDFSVGTKLFMMWMNLLNMRQTLYRFNVLNEKGVPVDVNVNKDKEYRFIIL